MNYLEYVKEMQARLAFLQADLLVKHSATKKGLAKLPNKFKIIIEK